MTKMIKNKEVIKSVRKLGEVLDIDPKTLRMWREMDEWNIIDRDLEDVVHLDGPQTRRCNKKQQQRVSTIGRLGRPSKISREIQDATDEGINYSALKPHDDVPFVKYCHILRRLRARFPPAPVSLTEDYTLSHI